MRSKVELLDVEPINTTSLKVTFKYYLKPTSHIKDSSLRLYYAIDGTGNNEHVDITEENADFYAGIVDQPRWYMVVYTLTNLSANTDYLVRIWLRVFKKPTSTSPQNKYKSPSSPLKVRTQAYNRAHPLFEIAKYSNVGEANEKMELIDCTQYVVAPTYDVNNVDTSDDWIDADYVTHRTIVRTKISGKFNIRFKDVSDYNNFIHLLYLNRQRNGKGYTEMRVQVNNELDYDNGTTDVVQTSCIQRIGMFFLKMDSNPYAEPYYGRYNKYNEVSVSIEEA